MSQVVNPNIPLDGLIYYIDPSNRRCFSGSGVHINNLVTAGFGGTLFNGTTTDAELRKSFIFDGSNDYITVPLPRPLSTGSSLSISLWAKWLTTGSGSTRIQTLVDNSFYDNATSYGFVIQDRPDLGGVLEWAASPGSGVTRVRTANVFGDNNWHHIVATNNGTTSKLYVDGVSNATIQSANGIGNTQPMLVFGRRNSDASRYLNGYLSNIKIFNRELSEIEITQDYHALRSKFYRFPNYSTDGLVLYYDLVNTESYPGSGSNIFDLSAYTNDGLLLNNPTYVSSGGGYLSLDGADDFVALTKSNSLKFTRDMSMEAWFTVNAANDSFICVLGSQYGTGNNNSYSIWLYDFVLQSGVLVTPVMQHLTYPGSISYDTWYHIIHTYDGSNQYMYVNGSLVASGATTGNILHNDNNTKVTIGADYEVGYNSGLNGFMKGRVGLVRLYNRALSQAEVTQNFNDSRARFGL